MDDAVGEIRVSSPSNHLLAVVSGALRSGLGSTTVVVPPMALSLSHRRGPEIQAYRKYSHPTQLAITNQAITGTNNGSRYL